MAKGKSQRLMSATMIEGDDADYFGPVDVQELKTARREFTAKMVKAVKIRTEDGRSREAALMIIKATRQFLVTSTALGVLGGPLAAPLYWLEVAFKDLDEGARHPMFAPSRTGRGAPKLTSEDRLRRIAAGQALEMLMWLGKPKKEAAAYIARKIKPTDMTKRGKKPVSPRTVIEWYHEFVDDETQAVIIRGESNEAGEPVFLVDGTSDQALLQMVDMLIAMASGRTITFPEADFMESLKSLKKQD